ncbi:MAG: addiction module protein [Bacteroidota bacterium]
MKELQQHILQLSPAKRLQLASFILASLSDLEELEQDPMVPKAWVLEAKNNIQGALDGTSKTYSWEEVKAKLNER